jgi:hypothetical protein
LLNFANENHQSILLTLIYLLLLMFFKVNQESLCHKLVIRNIVVELCCYSRPNLAVELEEDREAVFLFEHLHRDGANHVGIIAGHFHIGDVPDTPLILSEDACLPDLGNSLGRSQDKRVVVVHHFVWSK